MRRNKTKKTKLIAILLILVLSISIGYAALTANLTINGSATIKKQNWGVYFNNVQIKEGSISGDKVTTAPTTTGTTTTELNWEVSMDTPGEYYEFNVDVVNAGAMDAMIETATTDIATSTLTAEQQKYLDYTIKYVNGTAIEKYDKLKAGETKTITVKLLFKQDIEPEDLPQTAQTIALSYETNYVQADENAVTKITGPVTVTVDDQTSIYGTTPATLTSDAPAELDFQYQLLDENENVVTLNSETPVGEYTITGASSNPDYTVIVNTGTYNITKAPITVKVDDKTSVFGKTPVTLTSNAPENLGFEFKVLDPQNNNSEITLSSTTPEGSYTITGTYTNQNYDVTITPGTYTITGPLKVGDTVNYTTTLNGQTLNDWKVFYEEGEYTYIILGDYLPSAAISDTMKTSYNITTEGTYNVHSSTRKDLINAMTEKSNWNSLLTGTLNGQELNVSGEEQAWAMGAPDIELWVNSWNAQYPSDKLYTAQMATAQSDGLKGYYIGDSPNPNNIDISLSTKTGFNNSLYFPHQEFYENCNGYWLASPSAPYAGNVMGANCRGIVGSSGSPSSSSSCAFRPIVCLPTNLLNQ